MSGEMSASVESEMQNLSNDLQSLTDSNSDIRKALKNELSSEEIHKMEELDIFNKLASGFANPEAIMKSMPDHMRETMAQLNQTDDKAGSFEILTNALENQLESTQSAQLPQSLAHLQGDVDALSPSLKNAAQSIIHELIIGAEAASALRQEHADALPEALQSMISNGSQSGGVELSENQLKGVAASYANLALIMPDAVYNRLDEISEIYPKNAAEIAQVIHDSLEAGEINISSLPEQQVVLETVEPDIQKPTNVSEFVASMKNIEADLDSDARLPSSERKIEKVVNNYLPKAFAESLEEGMEKTQKYIEKYPQFADIIAEQAAVYAQNGGVFDHKSFKSVSDQIEERMEQINSHVDSTSINMDEYDGLNEFSQGVEPQSSDLDDIQVAANFSLK